MAPTALWPFKKCPTAVQTATVAITNSHNIVVTVSFETATNPVHISYHISYVFLLWNGAKKDAREYYFHKTTLVALFTTHMNLHTMEFPGETNFMEVPKICEVHEIYGPQIKSALQ